MSQLDTRQSPPARIEGADPRDNRLLSFDASNTASRSNAGTPVARTRKPRRIAAVDFAKGALVLIMVLYHWMNYFVAADGSVYKYLRFLTPSFIFITGFLISQAYLSQTGTSSSRAPKRLLVRGFKLLAIVLCLNVALSTMRFKGFETRLNNVALGDMVLAYFTGLGSVAFSVLVPIAYLLILSAGLFILSRWYRCVYHVGCALFIACALCLELKGMRSGYLQIFSIGMLGISVGHISMDRLNSMMERRLAILLAYLTYLSAITLWGDAYVLQIAGVCLSLAVLYWIGDAEPEASGLRQVVILLGQYSLFGYISQVLILQLLHRGLRPLGTSIGVMVLALLASVALTILTVETVDYARSRNSGVNKLYAAVFS